MAPRSSQGLLKAFQELSDGFQVPSKSRRSLPGGSQLDFPRASRELPGAWSGSQVAPSAPGASPRCFPQVAPRGSRSFPGGSQGLPGGSQGASMGASQGFPDGSLMAPRNPRNLPGAGSKGLQEPPRWLPGAPRNLLGGSQELPGAFGLPTPCTTSGVLRLPGGSQGASQRFAGGSGGSQEPQEPPRWWLPGTPGAFQVAPKGPGGSEVPGIPAS